MKIFSDINLTINFASGNKKEETNRCSHSVSSSTKTQKWEHVKTFLTYSIILWILVIITLIVVNGSDSDRSKLLNILENGSKLMVGFTK